MTLSIESLEAAASSRPPGYLAEVLASGKRVTLDDGTAALRVPHRDYRRLARKYQLLQPPPIREQIRSLWASLVAWQNAGRPVVSKDVLRQRRRICRRCEFFEPSPVLAFSRCGKCKCTGIKLWMGTESCPLGKW